MELLVTHPPVNTLPTMESEFINSDPCFIEYYIEKSLFKLIILHDNAVYIFNPT